MSSTTPPHADRGEGSGQERAPPSKPVRSPAAERALAEAVARRRTADGALPVVKEVNSFTGPDPVRYGDWEHNGIASDF